MTTLCADIETWIRNNLFDAVPMSIAVIDREFNVAYANKAFQRMFGKWKGLKCYEVYKRLDRKCRECKGAETFTDGIPRVNEEIGYNFAGVPVYYIKHTVPMNDEDGNVRFLVEMSMDMTEVRQIRGEYLTLFDQAPCNILLIDMNFKIVKTNKRLREVYGDIQGRHCYEVLKGMKRKCVECTAHQTFLDGKMHTGLHVWRSPLGKIKKYQTTTLPLRKSDGNFDTVMEMAVDVTKTLDLEESLTIAHTFMKSMIATSIDGIFAMDEGGEVTIFNPAARRICNVPENHRLSGQTLSYMLPEGYVERVKSSDDPVFLPETAIRTLDGEFLPARLAGVKLTTGRGGYRGLAFFLQDLREVKQLEKEKLDAERLAAVGATVAGLAHGVKNLLTALEGGIYMLSSGMSKGKVDRVGKGMEMLNRNVERISMFVKAFLSFSKGREIRAEMNAPFEIAREVADIYSPQAERKGIRLTCEQTEEIKPAAIDYESMHECLTNIVGNAIDACIASDDKTKCMVMVKVSEKNNVITYEITDSGCGMDYGVKQKVFTTFFTTKGLGGTGLGLLMSKKIVHEHGGTIELESEAGVGTTFRIRLPRKLLPQIYDDSDNGS